jgi:outer membrane biosynthesis protein TonB
MRSIRLLVVLLAAGAAADAAEAQTSPRLRQGSVPAPRAEAYGGGQVMLELTIDPAGRVTAADALVATPPFTDAIADVVRLWRFEPATTIIEDRLTPVAARVLLVAVFRPPSLYAGPAPGAVPQRHGTPSGDLPRPDSLAMPAYPPTAVGDGLVLVEIEMNGRDGAHSARVLTPPSGFDRAALDAVNGWRFDPPARPATAVPLFVYAILGFRAPVAPAARP